MFAHVFQDLVTYSISGNDVCREYLFVNPLSGALLVNQELSSLQLDRITVSLFSHSFLKSFL